MVDTGFIRYNVRFPLLRGHALKPFIMITTLIAGSAVFAEEHFEINKKNCNLPMKKIRELVPEKAKQEAIYRQCMKKAAQEKWSQKSLVSK